MVDRAGAAAPFAKASSLLGDLAGIALTTKRVERAAEADGAAAAVATQAHAGAILSRRSSPPPAGAAARQALHRRRRHRGADGARRNRRPGRQGRRRSGPAHTRETKLACLFTQTSLDPDGRPVRDPGSSTYLATLAPVEQFAPLVHAEARRRGSERLLARSCGFGPLRST